MKAKKQYPIDLVFYESKNSVFIVYAVYDSSKRDFYIASINDAGKAIFNTKFISNANFYEILDLSLAVNDKKLIFLYFLKVSMKIYTLRI
ncbi:MAG: hypothetical protein ACP5QM_01820 [Caldisericum sp.]|uniref:hypothetical protein n=1 Tax=Caldisericum sp. TaxID=2499687 RepID=UPI003D104249